MTEAQFDITFSGTIHVVADDGDLGGQLSSSDAASLIDLHLEEAIGKLMEIEAGDERLRNSDVSAKLATGSVEISITVAASADEAMPIGMGAIRAAVHAAGGYTPGWDTHESTTEWEMGDGTAQQRPVAC